MPRRVRSHLRPKLAQTVDAVIGRVARDDSTVNRSDRNAGDPVGMDIGFRQGLVDASLVCPERAAALQDQGDAFERKTPFQSPHKRGRSWTFMAYSLSDVVHEIRAV